MTREELRDYVDEQRTLDNIPYHVYSALIDGIDTLEQEPKTGHWIFDEILDRNYYCSECKSMGVDYWDFCPYCGAKMIEPQESEDKE